VIMKSVDCSEHRLRRRRVPLAVVQWLLLIVASFVAGCEAIALLPSHEATIITWGICTNVAMAIGIGVVLTWKGISHRLLRTAWLGAVVTVIGWDLLNFTLGEIQGQEGLGAIPFDVVALPVATLGMLVLLGVGAALGRIGRLISGRCPCASGPSLIYMK
jgi:hypothetical protein